MTATTQAVPRLPDPRRFATTGGHPLLDLAATDDPEAGRGLVRAVRELLLRRSDDELRHALGMASTRHAYARLWRAVCAASEGAGGFEDAVAASIFAMPLVIVSGARKSATVPGVLDDVNALVDVLRRGGALGASRNFGLSNALCSLEALERLPPSTVLAWCVPGEGPREIAPEPVPIRAGEEVHLRFLVGAAITPAAAPSIVETAAHVGAWGMPFARALSAQIAVPGVDLLAFPRPPGGIVKTAHQGRRAQLEVALNLFLSNAIKRMRAAAGEPSLVISAHAEGAHAAELRVSLSAVLDDTLLEGFRWPLHPLDDLEEIAGAVRQFAADCRLTDVRVVEAVLPEGGTGGVPLFVRAGDVPAATLRH